MIKENRETLIEGMIVISASMTIATKEGLEDLFLRLFIILDGIMELLDMEVSDFTKSAVKIGGVDLFVPIPKSATKQNIKNAETELDIMLSLSEKEDDSLLKKAERLINL